MATLPTGICQMVRHAVMWGGQCRERWCHCAPQAIRAARTRGLLISQTALKPFIACLNKCHTFKSKTDTINLRHLIMRLEIIHITQFCLLLNYVRPTTSPMKSGNRRLSCYLGFRWKGERR